jgi:hypothetical protein
VSGCFKTQIINGLKLKLKDEKFINKSRLLLNAFSRVRQLPFEAVVLFIIEKSTSSLSVSLTSFFAESRLAPTKSSFSQARAFLCFKVFKRLNLWILSQFYSQWKYKKWKGFRVLSVDGSTLRLPDHPTLQEKFSRHAFGAKKSVERWMSRISFLYDVLNGVVIDAQMESFDTSEANLCGQHLGFLRKGDLVIFDRYYASHYLFSVLLHKKVHFLFRMRDHSWKCVQSFIDTGISVLLHKKVLRMRDHSWKCVQSFIASGLKEEVVELNVYPYSKVAKKIPANVGKTIQVRLVKQVTRSGEIRVYATSLLDKEVYSRTAIINLYKQRWGIEEAYKTLKARLDVIHFSGKTVKAVQQDFYANVFLITLASVLKADIKPSLKRKKRTQNKDGRIPMINNTFTISQVKVLIKKIYHAFDDIKLWIERFNQLVKASIEYSRKGQSNPRKNDKGHHRVFAQNYKTI